MISPDKKIEPLREDIGKIVPNKFLTSTSYKRWIVANDLQEVWGQCLDYAKSEQSLYIMGDMGSITAGDALTLLLNHFYANKKDIVPQFVILLLKFYSEENKTSIDISNIRQDLLVAGFSEEQIAALNEISEVDNRDYDCNEEMSAEQKVRLLEKRYEEESLSEANSRKSIDSYLEWHKEALLYLSDFYSYANPDFAKFKDLDNSHNGYGLRDNFKSIYGIYNLLMKNATRQLNDKQAIKEKTPMVFISHSSKDKSFVEALVDLLEGLGLTKDNLFCSSVDGYGIPLGRDIFETIRGLFHEHELYVIFIHSPRYYESHVSLNEMGAAWVLKTDFCSILTKDMEFKDMTGVVNNSTLSIKVNSEDAPARLTEMKDRLVNMIGLIPIDEIKWERKRKNFLRLVSTISDDHQRES